MSTTTRHRGRRFKRVRASLPLRSLRSRVRTTVVLALACAALVAPAAALANDFQQVYDYYKKHGSISACQFTENQLRSAERQTPPDVEQYAPSFLDALATAREGAGNCSTKTTPAAAAAPVATTPTPSTPTPAPTASTPTPVPTGTATQPVAPTATPAPTPPASAANVPALDTKRTAHESSAPVAVWSLAGLAVLAVVAALAALVARFLGWGPARPIGTSNFPREFADWLRFGG